MTVFPLRRPLGPSRAAKTWASVVASSAESTSSRIYVSNLPYTARASATLSSAASSVIAYRCFWPPDRLPTRVVSPSDSIDRSTSRLSATRTARYHIGSYGCMKVMLPRIDRLRSQGSCEQYPTVPSRHRAVPPMMSSSPRRACSRVDLPCLSARR
jgi:hypothetical protein